MHTYVRFIFYSDHFSKNTEGLMLYLPPQDLPFCNQHQASPHPPPLPTFFFVLNILRTENRFYIFAPKSKFILFYFFKMLNKQLPPHFTKQTTINFAVPWIKSSNYNFFREKLWGSCIFFLVTVDFYFHVYLFVSFI